MNTPESGKTRRNSRGSGFTIVELLVSLALVIFIMSLVSTVFVLATKSFRDMKATGDLAEQLRSASQLIRSYVKASHFSDNQKLSDTNFWIPKVANVLVPNPTNNEEKNQANFVDRLGYFRVDQAFAPSVISALADTNSQDEGKDLDNIPLYRCNENQDYRLSMSLILDGKNPANYFTALYPSGSGLTKPIGLGTAYKYFETDNTVLRRKNAECLLFLARQDSVDSPQTGLLSDAGATGKTLYSLNLKTWILGDTNETNIQLPGPDEKISYSKIGPNYYPNDLAKVSDRANRQSFQFLNNLSTSRFLSHPDTSALILRNVVSFQVYLVDRTGSPVSLQDNGFFDTSVAANWTSSTNMMGVTTYTPVSGSWRAGQSIFPTNTAKITAIKIILRVYDPDNEITRQLTIIEPL